jgi:hypothetical protein
VRCGSRGRLVVSNIYPALATRVFDRCTKQILNDIGICRAASDTRISRDYAQRDTGAYGVIAAFAAAVEPLVDGRLHMHITLYGSKFNPSLLSRICALLRFVNEPRGGSSRYSAHGWTRSFKCGVMHVLQKTDQCRRHSKSNYQTLLQFTAFLQAAQMRVATTDFRSHTNTCFKATEGSTCAD